MRVSENAYVEAGAVMINLDTATLQAAANTAQAQFDMATQSAGASGSNVAVAHARLVSVTAALTETMIRCLPLTSTLFSLSTVIRG